MAFQDTEQSRRVQAIIDSKGFHGKPGGFTIPGGFTVPGGPRLDIGALLRALAKWDAPPTAENAPANINPFKLLPNRIPKEPTTLESVHRKQAQRRIPPTTRGEGNPAQGNPAQIPAKPGSINKSIKEHGKQITEKAKKSHDEWLKKVINDPNLYIDDAGKVKVKKSGVANTPRPDTRSMVDAQTQGYRKPAPMPVDTSAASTGRKVGNAVGNWYDRTLGDPGFRLEMSRLAQQMSRPEPNSWQAGLANWSTGANEQMITNKAINQGNIALSPMEQKAMSPEMRQTVQNARLNAQKIGQPQVTQVTVGDQTRLARVYPDGRIEYIEDPNNPGQYVEGDRWQEKEEQNRFFSSQGDIVMITPEGKSQVVYDAPKDTKLSPEDQARLIDRANRSRKVVEDRANMLFGKQFNAAERTLNGTDFDNVYANLDTKQREAYNQLVGMASSRAMEGWSDAAIMYKMQADFERIINPSSEPFVANSMAEIKQSAKTMPDGAIIIDAPNNTVYEVNGGEAHKIDDDANKYMGVE